MAETTSLEQAMEYLGWTVETATVARELVHVGWSGLLAPGDLRAVPTPCGISAESDGPGLGA